MLSSKEAQKERTILFLSKSGSQEEKSRNDERVIRKRRRTMKTKSKSEEHQRKEECQENKESRMNDLQREKQVLQEGEAPNYIDKGGDSLVENQFKTLAKAYTGFQLIMLNGKEAQMKGTIILLSKSGSQEGKLQNDEEAVQSGKRTMEVKSKSGEPQRKEENKSLYYNDKGDEKLVENQFENLARAITGFQHVMLSNNKDYPKGTNEIYTKSEVQNDQRKVINVSHKCSSAQSIIMTNIYSGIEQVCSRLEIEEEESTNTQVRESIENLASIYMHYSLGNRRERIKLFTSLPA
jgi:hypothetical protein